MKSWQSLVLAVTFFLASVAFWPTWQSPALAPKWIVLGLAVALLVPRAPPWGLALLAWAILQLTWSPAPLNGVLEVWHLALLVGAFAIGQQPGALRAASVGLACGIGANSGLVLWELANPGILPSGAPPSGLFYNRDILGDLAVLATLASWLVLRNPWLMLACLPAALATHSRTAGLALAIGAAAICWNAGKWWRIWGFALLAATPVVYLMTHWPEVTYDEAIGRRLAFWLDTWPHIRVWGTGLGGYEHEFPLYNTRINPFKERFEFLHNEFLQFALELGLGAGILLVVAWRAASAASPLRAIFLSGLVLCCLDFPLHIPTTGAFLALLAGHLCTAGARVRNYVATGRESVPVGGPDRVAVGVPNSLGATSTSDGHL